MPNFLSDKQFWEQMGSNVPSALAGSVFGTLGMPMDFMRMLVRQGVNDPQFGGPDDPNDPFAKGSIPLSSDWFGEKAGADVHSPSFDIARMAAIAPVGIGSAGAANKLLRYNPLSQVIKQIEIEESMASLASRAGRAKQAEQYLQNASELRKGYWHFARRYGKGNDFPDIPGIDKPAKGLTDLLMGLFR